MNIRIYKYFLLQLIFIVQFNKTITITRTSTVKSLNDVEEVIDTGYSEPIAEQLVQEYHRHLYYPQQQTSVTLVKHAHPKTRTRHKRVKKPKVKLNFSEPDHQTAKAIYYNKYPADYNPKTYSDIHFNLPTSVNYDTQNINVEFYNGYDSKENVHNYEASDESNDHVYEANEKYKETLKPNSHSSFTYPESNYHSYGPDISSYLYDSTASSRTSSALRKPHTAYGVPKKKSKHPQIPATKYGVPVPHHHFAEPPSLNFDLPRRPKVKMAKKLIHKHTHGEPTRNNDYTLSHHQNASPEQHLTSSPVQTNHYIPPSNELPISQEDKIAHYDYPKTSYEVPLYDQVPFDISEHEKFEIYPPHISEIDSHYSSSSFDVNESPSLEIPSVQNYYFKVQQKLKNNTEKDASFSRNRHLGNKHILDTPELKKAFEQSQRTKAPSTDKETQPAASSSIKVGLVKSEVWSPVKIRSYSSKQTTTTVATITLSNKKNHYQNYFRERVISTENPLLTTTTSRIKADILPVNKTAKTNHSSFLSTQKSGSMKALSASNHFNYRRLLKESNNTAKNETMISKRSNPNDSYTSPQRLTKKVLDIAPFKSPYNRDFTIQLPPNHKLF